MVDVVEKITRSRMMAGIRGKHTKPELILRHALHRLGLRYRLHVPNLPGRPDIVMPKYRAVVQVQGCFWHRHSGCSFATTPASNIKFWDSKFAETTRRDHRNLEVLRQLGWRVAIVWECAINKEGGDAVATRVAKWLSSKRTTAEIPALRAAAVIRTKS
jgi:DNA mismatch endonuclease (patch repair protein)